MKLGELESKARARVQLDPEEKEALFRGYFELFFAKLVLFFMKRQCSEDQSHDLAQDSFLKAFKKFESFLWKSSFQTWLWEIAGNVWRQELRAKMALKRKGKEISHSGDADAEGAFELMELASEEESPQHRFLAEEAREKLEEAVKKLPAQMRQCVLLRVYQELKYREIAVLMDLSIDTVKSQLFQARERLRELLKDYFSHIDL